MRTWQTIIGRPAWYDRNPTHKLLSWGQLNVAPHGETVRWTYTVPAGKKAFVESVFAYLRRSAAATTVGRAAVVIWITPSGGSAAILIDVEILTNNVGDSDRQGVGQSLILLPGDTIEARTVDISTGGTVNYSAAAKITEFDA
jgi:hypothetical protein